MSLLLQQQLYGHSRHIIAITVMFRIMSKSTTMPRTSYALCVSEIKRGLPTIAVQTEVKRAGCLLHAKGTWRGSVPEGETVWLQQEMQIWTSRAFLQGIS